jgi:hypothetical protein
VLTCTDDGQAVASTCIRHGTAEHEGLARCPDGRGRSGSSARTRRRAVWWLSVGLLLAFAGLARCWGCCCQCSWDRLIGYFHGLGVWGV